MIEIEKGWITKEGKEPREQTLSAGVLSQMLSVDYTTQLEYNLMSGEAEFNRQPIQTSFIDNFYVYLSERGWKIQKGHAIDALQTAAQKNTYHPVVDELKRIEHDDSIQPIELDQVATDYLGTSDPLYDAMLATTVIGLVNRTFHNGCKFDTCLVLTGKEGIRKSTFWKELATEDWFCDTWQSKQQDLFMAINQCLIYELAELDGITSAKAQASLKAVLSSATDTYKRPYATGIGKFPRPSILVATSNRCDFLSDPSADHRRFLIIPIKERIDTEKLKRDRERIIKAAIIAYRKGRKPYLRQELQDESNHRNGRFQEEHPFMDRLSVWVRTKDKFTSIDALIGSRCRSEENLRKNDLKEAANCLKALGYHKKQVRVNGEREYLWSKSYDT